MQDKRISYSILILILIILSARLLNSALGDSPALMITLWSAFGVALYLYLY